MKPSSLSPAAPLQSHCSPTTTNTHLHTHRSTQFAARCRLKIRKRYLKETPFLACICNLSQCLGPLVAIELRKINHRNRHSKEKEWKSLLSKVRTSFMVVKLAMEKGVVAQFIAKQK